MIGQSHFRSLNLKVTFFLDDNNNQCGYFKYFEESLLSVKVSIFFNSKLFRSQEFHLSSSVFSPTSTFLYLYLFLYLFSSSSCKAGVQTHVCRGDHRSSLTV